MKTKVYVAVTKATVNVAWFSLASHLILDLCTETEYIITGVIETI